VDKFNLLVCMYVLKAVDEKNEPMVAFLCNRPSMYQTEQGWMKDDNTGCLRDPVDILNYCRKVSVVVVFYFCYQLWKWTVLSFFPASGRILVNVYLHQS
jgi:hypothetical protein